MPLAEISVHLTKLHAWIYVKKKKKTWKKKKVKYDGAKEMGQEKGRGKREKGVEKSIERRRAKE